MKERLCDKIKRLLNKKRISRYKRIIRKYVQKYDEANFGSLMAYSWGIDEVTDYHVIAERSYKDHHVFGTEVTWYEKLPKGEESPCDGCERDCTMCGVRIEKEG